MTRNMTGRPDGPGGGRMAATLSLLAISLGVSNQAAAEPASSGAEPAQASSQHKVESVQGKHLTSGQIKGESVTCAQTKVESVQGKHRANTQIKGEGATCAQVKIESQQHKVESQQHKVEPKVAQPQA